MTELKKYDVYESVKYFPLFKTDIRVKMERNTNDNRYLD